MLALLLCDVELSVIALIGIILLIGIVKKNAIMMIDFALKPSARTARIRRRDLSGLRAALQTDYDDHDGGNAGRLAARIGHRHRL